MSDPDRYPAQVDGVPDEDAVLGPVRLHGHTAPGQDGGVEEGKTVIFISERVLLLSTDLSVNL